MNPVFELDYNVLAKNARFGELAKKLEAISIIDSAQSFSEFCRLTCRLWSETFGDEVGNTSSQFQHFLARIEQGDEDTIRTSWGGVVITFHHPPQVEKYLVIRGGCFLALEKHEEKDEHLEVREGAGLVLSRDSTNQSLKVEALAPGDRFHFQPGIEHCLIGTENLLVFEKSIDPKGMDQDLILLYEPGGGLTS